MEKMDYKHDTFNLATTEIDQFTSEEYEDKRYSVWPDSESEEGVYRDFDDLDEACEFASNFVHQFDGADFRVTLHIEDNEADETIDSYDNIMVGDLGYPVKD